MPLQIVSRVIGGAKQIHVGIADQILGAHSGRRQLLRGDPPDLLAILLADHKVAIKIALKLQMAPMIQWVADQLGHDRAICLELIKVGGIPRDILFIHAAGAHGAPLIMIAVQPHLCDIGIALILGNLARRRWQ